MVENYSRRECEVGFDGVFEVDGNNEFCHHTGYEVFIDGRWWNEYEDSNGELHYGN